MEAIPFILKFRSDAKFVFVGDGHMMEQLVQRSKQLNVGHAGEESFRALPFSRLPVCVSFCLATLNASLLTDNNTCTYVSAG